MSQSQPEIEWPTLRGHQLRDLGMARFGDPYKRLIVRELDDFIRGRPGGWELTYAQLAERCEIDEVTCRRKVAELVADRVVAVESTRGSPRKRFFLGYSNLEDHARPRAATRRGRRGQCEHARQLHGATEDAANGLHGATPELHGATDPLLAHNRKVSAPPHKGELHGATRSGDVPPTTDSALPATPAPALPDALAASPAFVAAWDAWLAYRRERRLNCRPALKARQLAYLAACGPEEAAAMLHQSIRNDWQGLFPLRDQGGNSDARPRNREHARQDSNLQAIAEFLREG